MKILVVEDESLMREVLVKLVRDKFGFKVVGEAGDGEEALELCRSHTVDMVLLDIMVPKLNGVDFAQIIFDEQPNLRILAISNEFDEFTLNQIFKSGVHGFVDKRGTSLEILAQAIETVATGQPYFTQFAINMKNKLRGDPASYTRILSDREQEVLRFFSQGMSDAAISKRLNIRPRTVQTHRHNILKKLELHGTPELMNYGIKKGFWKYRESVDGPWVEEDEPAS